VDLIAQHITPDRLLTLNVQREGQNTVLGFDSFAWCTSSEYLASTWSVSTETAVTRFLDEQLTNRAIIAMARVGEVIRDVWITEHPLAEVRYNRHEETVDFRFWDGSRWKPETLAARASEPL
jgi:hypothetical protein